MGGRPMAGSSRPWACAKISDGHKALNDVSVRVPPGTIGLARAQRCGQEHLHQVPAKPRDSPSAGLARLLGRDVRAGGRASREKIGYSPGAGLLHIPGMAGCEYVTYCGQLSGMPFRARGSAHTRSWTWSAWARRGIGRVQTLFDRDAAAGEARAGPGSRSRARRFSTSRPTGSTRRAGTRPQADRLAVAGLWDQRRHVLPPAARYRAVCDRVIIIGGGRILEHDSVEVLKTSTGG